MYEMFMVYTGETKINDTYQRRQSRSVMVQKVAVKHEFKAGLRHATTRKLCQPSSKWVPFSNQGRIKQRWERDGLRLSSAVPKTQWDSYLHCPTTIRLWETVTFYLLIYLQANI